MFSSKPRYAETGMSMRRLPHVDFADSALGRMFLLGSLAYLTAYALEAPIRYVLYLAGKDSLILARDGLIIGPLVVLFAAKALRLEMPRIFLVAGALLIFHALVLMGTVGSFVGAAYGVKIMINLLFGIFLAGMLIAPGPRTFRFLMLIWLITLVGACLDKFVLTFPWTGIKTIVGDLSVDVSKDWEIQDSIARRVAGFTRSSICVAVFLPPLTIVLMSRVRHWLARFILGALAFGVVLLSTQKGAIVAFAPVLGILCLPTAMRLALLRVACLGFMAMAIALPVLTYGVHMGHGTGVFSTESIYLRIAYTWPQAWDWINRHQMLVFGVGLGGIGGPQRFR
jgi:ABC-type antimicrobial peptide transport system permease subunit